ncbi:MAG: hypothetical protein RSA29_15470 [Clostridium sp.]
MNEIHEILEGVYKNGQSNSDRSSKIYFEDTEESISKCVKEFTM